MWATAAQSDQLLSDGAIEAIACVLFAYLAVQMRMRWVTRPLRWVLAFLTLGYGVGAVQELLEGHRLADVRVLIEITVVGLIYLYADALLHRRFGLPPAATAAAACASAATSTGSALAPPRISAQTALAASRALVRDRCKDFV